jgi:Holliday junction DNA helicase RuvB
MSDFNDDQAIRNPVLHSGEEQVDRALRPQLLDDFIGQAQAKGNLKIFVAAAKQRQEALDHVLLYGPPGLGKTTIAHIISRELGVGFRSVSGPMLAKTGDLAAILTNLETNDVLFIDEIHRLNPSIEEILYSAMEDYSLDLVIGEGPAARTVRIDLLPFTLVGATTRLGLLSNPLRDRFGIPLRLEFYNKEELCAVLMRGAHLLSISLSLDAALIMAARARGTPRIALRLLRRIRDFAMFDQSGEITVSLVEQALEALNVDQKGLDGNDRRYLTIIAEHYQGGPVGIETIAAALSEQRDALEETVEPYLMQLGLIQRTPRGRMLTRHAFNHLGLDPVIAREGSAPPAQPLWWEEVAARVHSGLSEQNDEETR